MLKNVNRKFKNKRTKRVSKLCSENKKYDISDPYVKVIKCKEKKNLYFWV